MDGIYLRHKGFNSGESILAGESVLAYHGPKLWMTAVTIQGDGMTSIWDHAALLVASKAATGSKTNSPTQMYAEGATSTPGTNKQC